MSWADQDLPDDADDGGDPTYGRLREFVTGWLASNYRRDLGNGLVWCPHWEQHEEAVSRLAGIWLTWEAAARDDNPAALSAWWRDHADPCMDRLLSEHGPFSACRKQHTERLQPLPTAD